MNIQNLKKKVEIGSEEKVIYLIYCHLHNVNRHLRRDNNKFLLYETKEHENCIRTYFRNRFM